VRVLPAGVTDRAGWAADIHAALSSLELPSTPQNLCAVVAVAEQESSVRVDPEVPGLPAIAWKEIDRRAESAGVPKLAVHAALALSSPDGRSYAQRIDNVKTDAPLALNQVLNNKTPGQKVNVKFWSKGETKTETKPETKAESKPAEAPKPAPETKPKGRRK